MGLSLRHLLLVSLLLLFGCGDPFSPRAMSAEARSYLEEALDTMQMYSINRYKINWSRFRERALARAAGARTPADTYDAIRFALVALGDNHSFFLPPGASGNGGPPPPMTSPTGQVLEDNVGYVSMPGFSHPDAVEHAHAYHRLLRGLDEADPCGWIVDLRQNTGGNMWPMLAEIGPVLGEGTAGFFVDPDNNRLEWYYEAGGAGIRSQGEFRGSEPPYVLRRPNPPVAVLAGPRTASSGEAIATAFRGRQGARSFGVGTRGLSTGNRGHRLRDGAMLILTEVAFADRTGRLYGGVIPPDEPVAGEATADPTRDPVVRRAAEWLRTEATCAAARGTA